MSESAPDMVAWLLEQLAVDERDFERAGPALLGWATYRRSDGSMNYTTAASGDGDVWIVDGVRTTPNSVLVVYDPAVRRADLDATRRIISLHAVYRPYAPKEPGGYLPAVCLFCTGDREEDQLMPCEHLKLLALPYADRPGYREAWRP
jgi:hypothetical protein